MEEFDDFEVERIRDAWNALTKEEQEKRIEAFYNSAAGKTNPYIESSLKSNIRYTSFFGTVIES